MSATYTVVQARYNGEKPGRYGDTLYRWYAVLKDEQGQLHGSLEGKNGIFIQRKSSDLEEGTELYGHIETGEYGPRFKSDPRPDNGQASFKGTTYTKEPEAGQSQPQMTKDDYWRRKEERDQESQARMGRAHAQEMALRWAAIVTDGPTSVNLETVFGWADLFHDDVQRFPLDADVGGATRLQSKDEQVSGQPVGERTADVSAEEAAPSQKAKATQLLNKAGISKEAQQAIVLFRCRKLPATAGPLAQLIRDLYGGATHDTLMAELWDAKNAGDEVAAEAVKMIPEEVPWKDDGSLPPAKAEVEKDDDDVPF